MATRLILIVTGLLAPLSSVMAAKEDPLSFNMPVGVTTTSQTAYDLHMLVFWVCVVIGIGVFSVMAWSLVRHRRSRGAVASQFHENTAVEVIWTLVPALILIAIAVPATKAIIAANAQPATPDVVIDVLGSQWKWEYKYPREGISFFSNLASPSRDASQLGAKESPANVPYYLLNVDHPMVVPVGKTVQVQVTSSDVIHSWWVPQLGFKTDAIPGKVNKMSFVIDKPGTYRGQCAELCGAGHAFMPIVVEAMMPAAYAEWMSKEKAALAATNAQAAGPWNMNAAMAQGKKVYGTICVACHQANGKGIKGAFPALDGMSISVKDHIDIVVHGSKKNPVMQAYGKQLSDRDIAAVITYERNAWGNHTGDLITPKEIEAAR